VWRTRLAAVLAAWIAVVLAGTIAAPRLFEVLPDGAALPMAIILFVLTPPALLAWSFWAMLRDPVTGWLAPTVLMAFCGALAPASQPLFDFGVRMNFEARRPAYEAIVAAAKAGRLGSANERGWVIGAQNGVRYRFHTSRPGQIEFVWRKERGLQAGVRYDDTPCITTRTMRCIARGRPLAGAYSFYQRIS
jgi:hypothetical protein